MGQLEQEIKTKITAAMAEKPDQDAFERVGHSLGAIADSVIRLAAEIDALRASGRESDAPSSGG